MSSHNTWTRKNAVWWQSWRWITACMPLAVLIVMCRIMPYDEIGHEREANISMWLYVITAVFFIFACSVAITSRIGMTKDKVARLYYSPSSITCVYPDNGNAVNCTVIFTVDDGTANGYSAKQSAKDLGYIDVDVSDTISEPAERLLPDGVTLVIPENLLKQKPQSERTLPGFPRAGNGTDSNAAALR